MRYSLFALSLVVVACGPPGASGPDGGGGSGDPRLNVAAQVSAPAAARPGDSVTLSYRAANVGSLPAVWMGELRFGHRDTPWERLKVVDQILSFSLLPAGEDVTGTRTVKLPVTIAGGEYQAVFRVEAGDDAHPDDDVATARISVDGPACADDSGEQDDVSEAARPLSIGVTLDRNFCFDPIDLARFEARAGDRFGVRLESTGADVSVHIGAVDAPRYVTSVDPGETVTARFTALADGTQYVWMQSTGQSFGTGSGYRLTLFEPRVDLAASFVNLEWDGTPRVGGIARARVDVRNHGYAMTEQAEVEFVLSADERLDAQDRRIDRQRVPPLLEGDWYYQTYDIVVPADVPAGQWFLIAVFDPDDTLAELREDNNVSEAEPLSVLAPECAPDAFEDDDRAGDAKAAPLGVVQSRNYCEDFYDWVKLDAVAGEAFTVEATSTRKVTVFGPDGAVVHEAESYNSLVTSFTAASAGTYRIRVYAGGINDIGRWSDYTLKVNRALPDLTAEAYVSTSTWTTGGVARAELRLHNKVPTAAGPFVARLYLSDDAVLDAQDRLLASASVDAVSGGGTVFRNVAFSVPVDLTPGSKSLFVRADADAQLVELDETNNVAVSPWSITLNAPACTPDAAEQDDFPATATALAMDSPQSRNQCDDGWDWFSISVTEGDPLVVRLDQVTYASGFTRLYAADGTTLLVQTYGGFFWRADRTGTVLVCAGCEDEPNSSPATYRMTAGLCPPDAHEPDDTRTSAKGITAGTPVALNFCEETDDWLTFAAVAGRSYKITISTANVSARPWTRFVDSSGSTLSTDRQGQLNVTSSGPVWIELSPSMDGTGLETGYTATLTEL